MDEKKVCKNCGVELPPNGYCVRCGYNNNINNEIVQQTNTAPIEQIEQNEEITSYEEEYEQSKQDGYKKMLIAALINFFIIMPSVSTFAGIWIIFGALGGKTESASITAILFIIYGVGSYIFLAMSLINYFVKEDKNKKIFKAIAFIAIIFFFFGKSILNQFGINEDTIKMKKNSMEEKYILVNSKLKVIQKDISYGTKYVSVRFSVEQKNGEPFVCDKKLVTKSRVNKYYITTLDSSWSNVTTDSKTGDCLFNISYYDLNKFNITDIYQIDLWLSDEILTFTTNSSKKDNTGDFPFLENDDNLLLDAEFFKMYFNQEKDYINVYIVSKLKVDAILTISNDDIDTPGYGSMGSYNALLYDNSISLQQYSYNPCEDNLSYIDGRYSFMVGEEKTEGITKRKYDSPRASKKYCQSN